MEKQRILLTGAAGGMGFSGLKELLKDTEIQDITAFVLDDKISRNRLKSYNDIQGLTIKYGDLTNYDDVYDIVKGVDIILHTAALVSPVADYYPQRAMDVNFGSMNNLVMAIKEQGREDTVKLVYIGTIAQTGDRMPPIHWGRIGDPIKTSIYDYYAVSKVAAERLLIESGLKYWVSLRQTGIIGPAMAKISDAIIFHNCLDNVLEYVSDRDSGRLLKNLCLYDFSGRLENSFWGHIYNIGGGKKCRISTIEMYKQLYGMIGFTNLKYVLNPKWYATKNFHGQYYLDSDKLNNHLDFREDSMFYFYDNYLKTLGLTAFISKFICKLPGGQRFMGSIIKSHFIKLIKSKHGTFHFIENNIKDKINAYWGCKKNWDKIPKDINNFEHFTDWDKVVHIDHGYDESKPEEELDLHDIKGAAKFRGGICNSINMIKGNWIEKLNFTCAFGHTFDASPRLILEGGHWCPECETKSWNYSVRAKTDPFFAQVWNPLHNIEEPEQEVLKVVQPSSI